MLKSGFTMSDIKDLHYEYEEEQPPPSPAVRPPRGGRTMERSRPAMDYGDSGDTSTPTTSGGPKTGGRAAGEATGRSRSRETGHKAKSPDSSAASKLAVQDKKNQRSKSPFNFLNRLRDASGDRRKGKTPEPNDSPRGVEPAGHHLKTKSATSPRLTSVRLCLRIRSFLFILSEIHHI